MRHGSLFIDRKNFCNAQFPVTQAMYLNNQFLITWCVSYLGSFNTRYNVADANNFGSREFRTKGLEYYDCKCVQMVAEIAANERPVIDVEVVMRKVIPPVPRGVQYKPR